MNICQWESCIQSSCHVCSQSIKNNNCLQLFPCNKKEFLHKYVIVGGTWIHHFTPELNRQSAEWTAVGESRSKRPKMQTSAGKVLASLFWDAQAIFFINYLEKGRTINNEYYIALLVHLKEEFIKKWPRMKKKKVLFHQDNTLCHKSMAKLHELHFKLLLHPSYFPDLAPSDYWLFADLKRMLQGKRFGSNEEVISETEAYFEAKQIILQRRHWIVREALESVYHQGRRLCWWIKSNFA